MCQRTPSAPFAPSSCPWLPSLLAVRPHLHQHFSNFSCNLCPRCTLDAGIKTREVPDHESVPMEHKEIVSDGCYHVSNTDDGAPSIRSACKGNTEPIDKGFAFHLNAEVNNCPSYSVPRLACRQFSAKPMANQGGERTRRTVSSPIRAPRHLPRRH